MQQLLSPFAHGLTFEEAILALRALPDIPVIDSEMTRAMLATGGERLSDNRGTINDNSCYRPNLLVCHDMKGNYLNDKWLNGSFYENAFQVLHWKYVDIFCYFSHKFITIPPANYVNMILENKSMKHVRLIGTVITEWEEGRSICEYIFDSHTQAVRFAKFLVETAKCNHLDGWLINIENTIDSKNVPHVVCFLRTLKIGMVNLKRDSVVLWYDSVIDTGELEWQNTLNDKNYIFYDACDGIFVNYTWGESHTCVPPELFCANNKKKSDVYFGIDVFGRGSYGGGRWNCDFAYSRLLELGFSVALFAPGWVLEEHKLLVLTGCSLEIPTAKCDIQGTSCEGESHNSDGHVDGALLSVESSRPLGTERDLWFWRNAAEFLKLQCTNIQYTLLFWNKLTICSQNYSPLFENARSQNDPASIRISGKMAAGVYVFRQGVATVHFHAWAMVHMAETVSDVSSLCESVYGGYYQLSSLLPVPFYDLNMQTVDDWDPSSLHVCVKHSVDECGESSVGFSDTNGGVEGIIVSIFYLAAYTGSSSLMLSVQAAHSIGGVTDCLYSPNLLSGFKTFNSRALSSGSHDRNLRAVDMKIVVIAGLVACPPRLMLKRVGLELGCEYMLGGSNEADRVAVTVVVWLKSFQSQESLNSVLPSSSSLGKPSLEDCLHSTVQWQFLEEKYLLCVPSVVDILQVVSVKVCAELEVGEMMEWPVKLLLDSISIEEDTSASAVIPGNETPLPKHPSELGLGLTLEYSMYDSCMYKGSDITQSLPLLSASKSVADAEIGSDILRMLQIRLSLVDPATIDQGDDSARRSVYMLHPEDASKVYSCFSEQDHICGMVCARECLNVTDSYGDFQMGDNITCACAGVSVEYNVMMCSDVEEWLSAGSAGTKNCDVFKKCLYMGRFHMLPCTEYNNDNTPAILQCSHCCFQLPLTAVEGTRMFVFALRASNTEDMFVIASIKSGSM